MTEKEYREKLPVRHQLSLFDQIHVLTFESKKMEDKTEAILKEFQSLTFELKKTEAILKELIDTLVAKGVIADQSDAGFLD